MKKSLKTTIQVITVLAVISIGLIIYVYVSDGRSTSEAAQEIAAEMVKRFNLRTEVKQ